MRVATSHSSGGNQGRNGPGYEVSISLIPTPFSHDPQADLVMTSAKKAETKVATLKGQEGN